MASCLSHGRGSPLRDRCLFPPKYVEGLVLPPDRYWNGTRTAVKSWCDALDAAEIGASVEQLLNHKDLILQDREVVAAAVEIFRSRPALGFTDCLLLEVARKAGHLPLGTFDRNLSKIDGAEKL